MSQHSKIHYNPAVDYYRLLNVPSSASLNEIRHAFRQKAKDLHPDRNPTRKAWAHQQFQQINLAYSVLADSELRQEYDRQRLFYLQQAFHTSPAPAATVQRNSSRLGTLLVVVLAGSGLLLGLGWGLPLFRSGLFSYPSRPSQPVFDMPDASPVYLWRPYEKQNCTDPNIQIHVPRDGQVIGWQEFTPHFTATGMSFVNYKLMLGTFRSDNQVRWEWIVGDQQSFQQTTLFGEGSWKPSYVLYKGRYVLRLIIQLQNQELRMCDSTFTVSY